MPFITHKRGDFQFLGCVEIKSNCKSSHSNNYVLSIVELASSSPHFSTDYSLKELCTILTKIDL